MAEIKFLSEREEEDIQYTFAIVLARYRGKWLFVRHKDRQTWELPAGHVEIGEAVEDAAIRELQEETGALDFAIIPLVSYRGWFQGEEIFGRLFSAEIKKLGPMPDYEIAEVKLFGDVPDKLTYPNIQPVFIEWYLLHR